MSATDRPLGGRRSRHEHGRSLVELVVAIALMGGVAIIAAALFVTALKGDRQVHSTTQATVQAQAIAQGIERSVRNGQRIAVSATTLTAWTTLGGSHTCQRWSLAGAGANATIQFAEDSTTPGAGSDFVGSVAVKGVSLTLTEVSAGGRVGLTYALTLPSETIPVRLAGTVRSRTLQDTTTAAGPATCGL